jgi:hypothetical protein
MAVGGVTQSPAGNISWNQPWDSPSNRYLLAHMPNEFSSVRNHPGEGLTYYRMFVGPGVAVDRPNGVRLEDLPDPAHTFLVVGSAEPVPWTMPEGLPYGPGTPLPSLGGDFREGFYALMADGSVRFFGHETSEGVLREYITGRPLPEEK